jgi:hypothetical protein
MIAKLIPVTHWSAARHDPPKPAVTLRRWCGEGKIPGAVKVGREWRVPSDAEYRSAEERKDLMDWIYGAGRKTA